MLRYLVAHLDAKDTVDGILQWWLEGVRTCVRPSDLSSALEDLVVRGWMSATSLAQGVVLYGLDKTRLAEVKSFLAVAGDD